MKAVITWTLLLMFCSVGAFAQTEKEETPEQPSGVSYLTGEQGPEEETWGTIDPGKGFLVGKTPLGSLSISGYMLVRYLNQLPAEQSFVDHLGTHHEIDTRNDIQIHRVMIWLKGWLYDPKLTYSFLIWGLNSTNSTAIVGSINYEFSEKLTIGGGIDGMPGIRSLNGQHPYFLGTDRQLAEEFFKPSFTSGVWARGAVIPSLNYRFMIGDNLSQVGVNAAQMSRDLAYGGSIWWMPTTGEFGPRGGFGDYEIHDKLATRFGVSSIYSREDRQKNLNTAAPGNTQVRLSDSLLLFEPNALAKGVIVEKADYRVLTLDAAMKYRGFFVQTEFYFRWLSNFLADGPVPIDSTFDQGVGIHSAYQIIPKKFEGQLVGSYIFGEFNDSWELGIGGNYYPFDTRNFRFNALLSHIDRSPVDSLFGYYVGGQTGPLISVAADIFF
ncbi:MAG TPA: hypothetical protein VM432_07210 [Bdellovibrionales bacterium]|nr:hypothetical protein [Bdellovibrionales bacterium]